MDQTSEILAARFYEPLKQLKLDKIPGPKIGDADVLVGVKAAGICHSELHVINGKSSPVLPPPVTLGYEASGVILEKGRNVTNVEVGDRVGIDYVLSCGKCDYCLTGRDNLCDNYIVMSYHVDGSWAEKVSVPSRHVHKLPSNIGFPEGAILNCAVLTAYHAAKIGRLSAGDTVLVYGLGGVGLSLVQWAKLFGATEIFAVDLEDAKLALAKRKGATTTLNPRDKDVSKEIRNLTKGGVRASFEVIGRVDTARKTVESVRKGGRAVFVGMCFDPVPILPVNDLMTPEISVMSPQDHLKAEVPDVLKFVESG